MVSNVIVGLIVGGAALYAGWRLLKRPGCGCGCASSAGKPPGTDAPGCGGKERGGCGCSGSGKSSCGCGR